MLGIGGGASKSKSESQSYLPVQAAWLTKLLQDIYGPTAGAGQEVYEGARVAPMTSGQTTAISGASDWSKYLTPTGDMPMYGETGAALSDILSGSRGADPYTKESVDTLFKTAYEAPAKKQWSEFTRPAIEEAYSGPGYWSSSRMEAEKRGAQDVADTLGAQYGELTYATDAANKAIAEAKAGRTAGALQTGISYGQAPTQNALAGIQGQQAIYGLTSAEQQQQQAEMNAAIQKFAEENRLTDPEDMQILLTLLGMSYSSAESKGSSWNANIFGGSTAKAVDGAREEE